MRIDSRERCAILRAQHDEDHVGRLIREAEASKAARIAGVQGMSDHPNIFNNQPSAFEHNQFM